MHTFLKYIHVCVYLYIQNYTQYTHTLCKQFFILDATNCRTAPIKPTTFPAQGCISQKHLSALFGRSFELYW